MDGSTRRAPVRGRARSERRRGSGVGIDIALGEDRHYRRGMTGIEIGRAGFGRTKGGLRHRDGWQRVMRMRWFSVPRTSIGGSLGEPLAYPRVGAMRVQREPREGASGPKPDRRSAGGAANQSARPAHDCAPAQLVGGGRSPARPEGCAVQASPAGNP